MGWAQVSRAMALDPKVTPSEMRVYVAIATYRGDGDRASPGVGRIARETGLSDATVKRAVAGLVGHGYLSIVRSGGGRASNTYRLLGSNGLTHAPGSPMTGVTGDRGHPCTCTPLTHDPAGGSPMTYEEEPSSRTKIKNTPSPSAPAPGGGDLFGDQTQASKVRTTPAEVIAAYMAHRHSTWVVPTLTDGKAAPSLAKTVAAAIRREPGRDWSETFAEMATSPFLRQKSPKTSLAWCIGPSNLGRWDAGEFRDEVLNGKISRNADQPSPYREV